VNIAFCSAKDGAATTAMLAVAAAWPPGRRVVAVEVDPAGGDIAVRFGLATEPGLVSLAAARRPSSPDALTDHVQLLPGGLPVVLAPASADQVQAALRALGERLADVTAGDEGLDVLLDCGRLGLSSPAGDLARRSGVTVFVARPTAEEVAHLRGQLSGWNGGEVGLVLVGDEPYGPVEVSEFLGVEVYGVLARDPLGAAALAGRPIARRSLARTPLMTSAIVVAQRLATFAALAPPEPGRSSRERTRTPAHVPDAREGQPARSAVMTRGTGA
jgi:hypothetical protein